MCGAVLASTAVDLLYLKRWQRQIRPSVARQIVNVGI